MAKDKYRLFSSKEAGKCISESRHEKSKFFEKRVVRRGILPNRQGCKVYRFQRILLAVQHFLQIILKNCLRLSMIQTSLFSFVWECYIECFVFRCYFEVGETFSFDKPQSPELQKKLLERSPIILADKVGLYIFVSSTLALTEIFLGTFVGTDADFAFDRRR